MTDQEIPEPDTDLFDYHPTKLFEIAHKLNYAEDHPVDSHDSIELASYVEALKQIEKAAEEARKQVFEPKLDEYVEPGESIGNLTRRTRTQRYVEDNAEAFDAILDNGLDPREYAKVNVTDLDDALGAQARELLGERSYSFYERQG